MKNEWRRRQVLSCTTLLLLVCFPGTGAQAASWVGIYGGPKSEWGTAIVTTSDGGYLVVGGTESYGAGREDGLVMKLTAQGTIEWARVLGTSAHSDEFEGAVELPDGGFAVVGGSYGCASGALSGNLTPWLARFSAAGDLLWQKYYQPSFSAMTYGIKITHDGGFILCGHWWDTAQHRMHGYLMKVSGNGDPVWHTAYGPPGEMSFHGILEMPDGSFFAAGVVLNDAVTANEGCLLKVDASGAPVWEKRFEIVNDYNSGDEHPSALLEASDGNILFAAGSPGQVRKVDQDGNTLWSLRIDWTYPILRAPINSLVAAPDGGYYAAGWYGCYDDGYCPPPLMQGAMLVKISEEGALEWAKVYKSYGWTPSASAVCLTPGGEPTLAGSYLIMGGLSNLLAISPEDDGSLLDACAMIPDMPAPWTGEPSSEHPNTTATSQAPCEARVATATISGPTVTSSDTMCPVIQSVSVLQSPFRLDIKGFGFTGLYVYLDGQTAPITKLVSEYEVIAKKGSALKAMLPKGKTVCVQVGAWNIPSFRSECFMFTR